MRCEGYRRYGGAFTCGGLPKWEQCREEATMLVTVKQDNEVKTFPACEVCYQECKNSGIEILGISECSQQTGLLG